MELIKEICTKTTISNAKRWLLNKFPNYLLQAGLSIADIQSPTISDMPIGSVIGNSNETKIVHAIECQNIVNNTLNSINRCSSVSRVILVSRYIKDNQDWQVANKLGYGLTRYQELKNRALLEFANAMEACDINLIEYK